MPALRRSLSDRRQHRHLPAATPPPASPLLILQARFQRRQLREKEERLVRLYEEQQERALRSVGSRSHSGGSSVSSSSSVGVGRVRHMFQSRREGSEPRLGATITGRDKSHPLEPLAKHPNGRHVRDDRRHRDATARPPRPPATWGPSQHDRSLSLDRNANPRDFGLDEHLNRGTVGARRTQSQTRAKPRQQSPADPRDGRHGQSFQLVGDRIADGEPSSGNELWLGRSGVGRRLCGGRGGREGGWGAGEVGELQRGRMEGRYKSYVSQGGFGKKVPLGGRQTAEAKEGGSSGYLNGSVSSPVRKIRKPTPVPLSVAPPQHLLQKESRKTTRVETIREVPSSVPTPKTLTSRTSMVSVQKPPTPGKGLPPTRASPTKTATAAVRSTAVPSDLVNCRTCGRHFAADRVSKHEEVCQKSSRNKRKPFDALQQRVKGTEVEQFIKKAAKPSRAQPEKAAKPQSNWRKKHEEFINNIRAAKEVSAHLKKGGKLSDLPPPPPSDYSDYVPCPHCGRKFSSAAAERHIPKCANIINNKPKPALQKTGGLKQSSKLLRPAPNSFRGRK